MTNSTRAKYDAVLKAVKNEGISIKEACTRQGMAPAYFYQVRKKTVKTKRKYAKKPKFIDIPLVPAQRDVVIVCNPGALKAVLEQWS